MPKIPIVSARKLIKVLKKEGFVLNRTKGSHFIFIRDSDKRSVSVPNHPGKDLGRGIIQSILKDADISIDM